MKRKNLLTFGIGLLLSAIALPMNAQVVNDDNEDGVVKLNTNLSKYDYVQGQVLVKFKDANRVQVNGSRGQFRSTSVNRLTKVLQKYGTEEMEQLLPNENPSRKMRKTRAYNGETIQEKDLSQLYRVKLSAEHIQETTQFIDELKTMDEVEFAEPNYILHTLDDVIIDGLLGGNPLAIDQWYLADYGVTQLWNKPIINSTRPVIAILDTGVDMTHPDLSPNLWTNAGEADGEKGYDNDGNGFKNDLHGWDFINNTANVRDYNMHGTHVAGIAAAANNGIGIIGANPRALIMPVTVMQSDGSGDVATIIKGINYAVQNGATVLNLSLGTYANSRALRQALENAYQKAVIVAAAGNDAMGIYPECGKPFYKPMFPAAYSSVLGVQAKNNTGKLASFSNFDCDGPNYSAESTLQDSDGFNYELMAPGVDILSTIPGGKYKALNGTSMAAPLVSGAISALKMVKQYDTQEILWGDLLHADNIAQAYNMTIRPAELDLMKVLFRDKEAATEETEEDYSNDGEIDAGETVYLYPVIRTTFGAASNIRMHLEMGDEFEDPDVVEIMTDENHKVNFGIPLSAYGKGVSLNPLILKVKESVADNRHIKMKFVATCDETNVIYEGHFTMVVTNTVKIGGVLENDLTLHSGKKYLVNRNLGIPENIKLTIEPNTVLEFKQGVRLSSSGTLQAKGLPSQPILFTGYMGELWNGLSIPDRDVLEYCIISNVYDYNQQFNGSFSNCIISDIHFDTSVIQDNMQNYGIHLSRSNLVYTIGRATSLVDVQNSNVVDNSFNQVYDSYWYGQNWSNLNHSNYFNNDYDGFSVGYKSEMPIVIKSDNPSYLGTSSINLAKKRVYDVNNTNYTFAVIDLSNMLTQPVPEAHGVVWKVLVNDKDSQDEYEDLAPLGVGKHKFEVYFNRPMNKAVAPQISFGVREPFVQNAVDEDGEGSGWNEEGTIYTAYKTITGKTKSDGVNRIYVRGAEDNEYFEIPYEKTRFNVMINAAGSLATGFVATPGMGKVDLTLDHTNNNFDDAMGFNIYRYELDDEGNEVNNTCLNQEIIDIETEDYTDYDVMPGTTYYYMYKVLSTDLQEYDVSNVVAATPLTTTLGDADGSGDVKVGDVITTVNYILGENPKPFIYEAADLNTDKSIDVLDVIGIIQIILNQPSESRAFIEGMAQAVYTVENGILFIESPVALSGLQIQLSTGERPVPTAEMKGFEVASSWLTENDYRMLAYSFGSKTLAPGKHAIMTIGDADLTSLRLADTAGNSVLAVPGEATLIKDAMGSKVMTTKGVWNLSGQKVMGNAQFTIQNSQLKKGVYIIDGQKVVK